MKSGSFSNSMMKGASLLSTWRSRSRGVSATITSGPGNVVAAHTAARPGHRCTRMTECENEHPRIIAYYGIGFPWEAARHDHAVSPPEIPFDALHISAR